ncbi:MAG: RraA family protein [Rhodobacteraceae bacterium]|nr:RraA family protein [Paracoccaceae bacterium]
MIEEPPVLTITRTPRRPSAAQIEAFQGVPTGFVVDALKGGAALDRAIRPMLDQKEPVAGPALTVDCGPADIMATLAALKVVQPGDVVMVAFAGFQGCAAAGDRVCGMMKNNGAVGLVTDGPVRDHAGLSEVGLPVWATGLTPESPFTKGPGKVGFPVQIGGRQVETGDMIVADFDGVVVVPFDRIDEVIEALVHIRALEEELDQKVAEGLKIPPAIEELLASDAVSWVD